MTRAAPAVAAAHRGSPGALRKTVENAPNLAGAQTAPHRGSPGAGRLRRAGFPARTPMRGRRSAPAGRAAPDSRPLQGTVW